MAKGLRDLAMRDLVFVDENHKESQDGTLGTIMYLEEGTSNLSDGGVKNYFFVPYDGTGPFRISSYGKHKVHVSQDHQTIFGHSDNYLRGANREELEDLAQFEGLRNMGNPLNDSAPLIHPKNDNLGKNIPMEERFANINFAF